MENFVAKPRLDLAASISRGTVQRLRAGRGQLSSLQKAMEAAHLDFVGLPRGETLGARVAVLRWRRGLSQEEVARRAGLGRDAVINLEVRSVGRVDALRAVLRVLGTKLALRETVPRTFFNGLALASGRTNWKTPQWVLAKLYEIFGEFDLDPAAGTPPNVRAKVHYGLADDGLFRPWFGTCFVNPPYGKVIGAWVSKCKREHASGRARVVVALLPARIGSAWWRQNVVGHAAAIFLAKRLRFDDGPDVAPFDVGIVLWGAGDDEVTAVLQAFEGSWLAR